MSRGVHAIKTGCVAFLALSVAQQAFSRTIDASFTGGSIVVNGSATSVEGTNTISIPGQIETETASAAAEVTSGLVSASAELSASVSIQPEFTTVTIITELEASQPAGYGGYASISVAINPIRFTLTELVDFKLQETGYGYGVEIAADPTTPGAVFDGKLFPGSYFITSTPWTLMWIDSTGHSLSGTITLTLTPSKEQFYAAFSDGALFVTGFSTWPVVIEGETYWGNDFAQNPGYVNMFAASAGGSTSGGLIEGELAMTADVSSIDETTVVQIDALASATQPQGYGGSLSLTLQNFWPTEDERPLRLSISRAVNFTIEDKGTTPPTFMADPQSTGAINEATLVPGSYLIATGFGVGLSASESEETRTMNWKLTLTPIAPCPADTNSSGTVDVDDLLTVINQWGPSTGAGDVTGNGIVDVDDLLAVINAWGSC